MGQNDSVQKILNGKAERIYRRFIDANGALFTPTTPYVRVYNPNGVIVSSGTPTAESTGVYFLNLNFGTSGSLEGYYQAYWEGYSGSRFITMDIPQYFYFQNVPWQLTVQDSLAMSIRRLIGDTNPENYRISVQDMYYFIQDAVNDVQSILDWGYTLTIAPTSLTWNTAPVGAPRALFRLRTLILVLKSILHDDLYDGGSVQVGDIKIDITQILKIRQQQIKDLEAEYKQLVYEIKMNYNAGYEIDTYVTGLIDNNYSSDYWVLSHAV